MKNDKNVKLLKKIIIGLTLTGFIYIGVSIFLLGWGTPIGILMAKHKLDSYIDPVYGKHAVHVRFPEFNITNNDYEYELTTPEGKPITTISCNNFSDYIGDLRSSDNPDPYLVKTMKKTNQMVGGKIIFTVPDISSSFDSNQDFTRQSLKRNDQLYLGIINTDVTIAPEESSQTFYSIVQTIFQNIGDGYNFTFSEIGYTDINGVKRIQISAQESHLPYYEIQKRIINPEGLDDIKIIENLKAVKNGTMTEKELKAYIQSEFFVN